MIFEREAKFLINIKKRDESKAVRKFKKTINYFVFFDTETTQQIENIKINKKTYKVEKNSLQMGWACFYDKKKNIEEWNFFTTKEEFYSFLEKIFTRTKNNQLWIMAHNIAFDIVITDLIEYFNFKEYENQFVYNKGMTFISSYKKGKKKISLVNTGNYYPTTLKQMGEFVGLNKMEVNFEKDSWDYIKEYCKRDVEIIKEFMKKWSAFVDIEDLGRLKYTTSGQAFEGFKKRFLNEWIHLHDIPEVLELERNCYYGGRTEAFVIKKIEKPIYYYDVNSMYPFTMLEYTYPTVFKFDRVNENKEYALKWLKLGYMACAEVEVNSKSNWIPFRSELGLVFPKGEFTTYLSTPEIIKGLESGEITRIKHIAYYEGKKIFFDYVDFFYKARQKYKSEKNKIEQLYKLLLNSLYGKFGQKNEGWEDITPAEINKQFQLLLFDGKKFTIDSWIMGEEIFYNSIFFGGEVLEKPKLRYFAGKMQIRTEDKESDNSFCAIASHVTAYARLLLFNYINYCKERKIKVYYCDTDSMFVDKEIKADFICDKTLGKLKLETCYKYGVDFKGLKNYSPLNELGQIEIKKIDTKDENKSELIPLTNEIDENIYVVKGEKWHCKGISNKARIINENTFIQQEWSGIGKQEYYTKWGRQKGEYWVVWKEKKNSGKYKKGVVRADGDIEQLQFQNK